MPTVICHGEADRNAGKRIKAEKGSGGTKGFVGMDKDRSIEIL